MWDILFIYLECCGLKNVLVVCGNVFWEVVKKKFFVLLIVIFIFEVYNGGFIYEECDCLVVIMEINKMDVIIVVGGGKIVDVCKVIVVVLCLLVIILLIFVLICVVYILFSVMYDEEGVMICYDVFVSSNVLLLIDLEMILDLLKELLVVGIGDMLVKWYEVDVIINFLLIKLVEIEIVYFVVKMCCDNLL